MNKKISSLLMAATMTATTVTPAFASEIHVTEAGSTGNSKVTFEVVNTGSPEDPTIFSAYVPAVLPIKMDLEGNITVPTNAKVVNDVKDRAIQVEDIDVVTTGDWQHVDKESAAAGAQDSHLLGLSMNNQDLTDASFPWKVGADDSLSLNMEAVIPQQTAVSADEQIATIAFTLDWAEKEKQDIDLESAPGFYDAFGQMVCSWEDSGVTTCDGAEGEDKNPELIRNFLKKNPTVTQVRLPDTPLDVGNYSFKDCKNIKAVVFGDGLFSIGYGAFINCSSLETLIIPAIQGIIVNFAFDGCSNLKNIYFGGTAEQFDAAMMSNNECIWNANIVYNYQN